MKRIIPVIKPGDSNEHVINLQEALLALLRLNIFKALDDPNYPTADDLKRLAGLLQREKLQSIYGDATTKLVQIFQIQNGLGDNLRGVVEEKTAELLNGMLEVSGLLQNGEEFEVYGRIIGATGKAKVGLIVQVFDRDIRKEQLLGEAITNAEGKYEIRYGIKKFGESDAAPDELPDLLVRAYTPDGKVVTESQTYFNAGYKEIIDLTVTEPAVQKSEWEMINDAVAPLLQNQGPNNEPLRPWELVIGDLEFIRAETGLDVERLQLWHQAYQTGIQLIRFLEQPDTPVIHTHHHFPALDLSKSWEIFASCFAWFRNGLSTELMPLMQTPVPQLISVLEKSTVEAIIPSMSSDWIKRLTDLLKKLQLQAILAPAGDGRPGSLSDLLDTLPTPVSPEKKLIVANALLETNGNDEELVPILKASNFDEKEITDIRVTRKLGEITGNHTALVKELQTIRNGEQDPSIQFLAGQTPLQWQLMVDKTGASPEFVQDPSGYARHLQRKVEEQYPTAVFASRVNNDLLEVTDPFIKTTTAFLAANPGFELKDQNAREFVNNGAVIDASVDKEMLVGNLQRIQRIQKMADTWEESGVLLNKNYHSALDIIHQGYEGFIDSVKEKIPAESAKNIFLKAQEIHDDTLALIGNYVTGTSYPVFEIFTIDTTKDAVPAKNFPRLNELFGNLDACECNHCESVLSPAAYLVDIMHALDTKQKSEELNPLLVLLERRPDIEDLELTCANTNTQLPYVDLVMEMLENAIALPMDINPPYGFNPSSDFNTAPLASNVETELRKVLKKTSINIGKQITVKKPTTGSNVYIVSDGARTWTLKDTVESISRYVVSPSLGTAVPVTNFSQAIASLNQGQLPSTTWIIPAGNPRDQYLPLVGTPVITTVIPGQKWQVQFKRAVHVEVIMGSSVGAVKLNTVDGQLIEGIQLPTGILQMIVGGLMNNHLVSPLFEKLPSQILYNISRISPTTFKIEARPHTTRFHFSYTSKKITINSLTYQSTGPDDNLKVIAENRNPEAYVKLETAKYPWTLPFNLWMEEIRAFLNHSQLNRAELMAAYDPANRLMENPAGDSLATEILGLTKSDRDNIAPAGTQSFWEFYNLSENNNTIQDPVSGKQLQGSWTQVLAHVSVILDRTGLTYPELLNVLQTKFVMKITPAISITGDECNTSQQILNAVKPAHFDRIHRLVRLSKKTGWTLPELDMAIAAVTNNSMDLTAATLRKIASIRRLQQLLNLPVITIASWFNNLVTETFHDHTDVKKKPVKSIYEKIFLNTTIQNPPDPDFELSNIQLSTKTLQDKTAFLSALFNLQNNELTLLINAGVTANANLSLPNLVSLYRSITLARKLKLSITDYLLARKWINNNPFQSQEQLVAFVEAIQQLKSSPYKITWKEIDYLLGYKSGSAPDPLFEMSAVQKILSELRSNLQAVQLEVTVSAESLQDQLTKIFSRFGWYPALVEESIALIETVPVFDAVVTGANQATTVTVPANLNEWVSYIAAQKRITINGALTTSQWTGLLAANSNDTNVTNAFNALKAQSDTFLATKMDVIHRLQSFDLPTFKVSYTATTTPVIPPAASARCYYLKSGNEVVFTGWITNSEETLLQNVFQPDIIHSTNGLKDLSDQYVENDQHNRFLVQADLADLFQPGQTPASRKDFMLARVLKRVFADTITANLANAFGLSSTIIRTLLKQQLSSTDTFDPLINTAFINSDSRIPVTAADFDAQLIALNKLHKAGLIAAKLNITDSDFPLLPTAPFQSDSSIYFDALILNSLPAKSTDPAANYKAFEQLVRLIQLREANSALLQSIAGRIRSNNKAALLQDIATAYSIPVADVTAIADTRLQLVWHDHTVTPKVQGDYVKPDKIGHLLALSRMVRITGLKEDELFSLTGETPGIDEALLARNLFKSQFTDDNWHEQLKPVSDSLREKQRDALNSYLVATKNLRSTSDLYDHYLVDTEMSACKMSTRILHAVSSVQLFIQRSHMNLEPEVSPDAIAAEKWQWMKNYRVWEANRKVFLYPENWIEPELREDKSAIFKELEGQILQNELNNERAEDLIRNYLKQLGEVARLNIVGMYVESPDTASVSGNTIVHIVGRTLNRPAHFYYRQWVFSATVNRWTPWESLPLDGVKTDHILPFVLRSEVFVAWPEFTQLGAASSDAGTKPPQWKLQMSWIKKTSSGWTDRRMSSNSLEHPWTPGKDENSLFTFKVRNEIQNAKGDTSVAIDCIAGIEKTAILYTFPIGDQLASTSFMISGAYNEISKFNPWMYVIIKGRLAASYKESNNKMYDYVPGALIKCSLIITGDDPRHDFNHESYWQGYSFPDYSPTKIQDALTTHTVVTGYTDANGFFYIQFGLVARAMYHPDVLNSSPKFRVEVVSIPGSSTAAATPLYKEFDFRAALSSSMYRYVYFTQNFEQERTGAYPGGSPTRELEMTRIAQFEMQDAEDATFQPRSKSIWTPPAKTSVNASRYIATGGSGNDILQFPDSNTTVWNGLPQPYSLLPGFPAEIIQEDNTTIKYKAPQVMVYSDRNNSYYVRNKSGNSTFNFEIMLDGHPRAHALRHELNQRGTDGLFDLAQQSWKNENGFDEHQATTSTDIARSVTIPAIRFDPKEEHTPYAGYNTELFFHVPFLIASYLSNNQRYAEAQQWFHRIFDPTTDEATTEIKRYWKYLPFREQTNAKPVDELMKILSKPGVASNNPDKEAIKKQIETWLANPFRPHAVAKLRPRAYMFSVVFKYLDNLIAWGDQLFRQHTTESVNEATQLYILAEKLLGPRPRTIPKRTKPAPLTYRSAGKWDEFSNTWVEVESNLNGFVQKGVSATKKKKKVNHKTSSLSSIGMLYFSIPANEKMLTYWDTIEERLFNIRHCRNIEGVEQEIALFQPAIDPGLLVRAAAAGLDLSTVYADQFTPLPYYRFSLLSQKASELCSELKSLGGALLSALEKKDSEELSLLRSTQEIDMLNRVREIKLQQIEEAKNTLASLRHSEKSAITRYVQYQRLLGSKETAVPEDDTAEVTQASMVAIPGKDAPGEFTGLGMIQAEIDQISWSDRAMEMGVVSGIHNIVSGIGYAIPDVSAGTPFLSSKFGGTNLGSILNAGAAFFSTLEKAAQHQSGRVATIGQFQRRQDDWVFQCKLALSEVQQIRKQIIAAEIRASIAESEVKNHDKQISNARELERFMKDKYTNKELFTWMSTQLSTVYFQIYNVAVDLAKKAERAFRHELGLQDSKYVRFGYWDNLRKGLLSGERLYHDLKRMEVAFLDQNKRELELSKNISLRLLDPMALITLKETGKCEIILDESFFDADYPGHYMRRIKSASLTIPCISGPYTSVNCTLTLLSSKTRISNTDKGSYGDDMFNDNPRVVTTQIPMQSIASSSAQNDAGMFEVNFRDDRYLPFEGAGAVSRWRIELPKDTNAFSFESIADLIIRLNYTARDGGKILADASRKSRAEIIADVAGDLARYVSVRHEFPDQWFKFFHPVTDADKQELMFSMGLDQFPYLFRGKSIVINKVQAFLKFRDIKDSTKFTSTNPPAGAEFLNKPLGDYSAGVALDVKMTMPDNNTATGTFTSSGNYLKGLPHFTIGNLNLELDQTNLWKLEAVDAAIASIAASLRKSESAHSRLKGEIIEDIILLFHYSVE